MLRDDTGSGYGGGCGGFSRRGAEIQ